MVQRQAYFLQPATINMLFVPLSLVFSIIGLFGPGILSATEPRFFTYEKTSRLPTTDDGSQMLRVFPGIPLGQRIHNIIYVCANGLVTFGAQYCTYVPNMKSGHDMVAPYWSDLDYRGLGSQSGVYFSFHKDSQRDQISRQILQETKSYILSNTNMNDFNPTLAVVVTWLKAAPYPSSSYINTIQRATFQLNLATDGKNTYAVFIYADGKMLWNNYGRPPHVGYSVSGDIVDMHLSNTGKYRYFRFDSIMGNTGKNGQWMWKLSGQRHTKVNTKDECIKWFKQQPNADIIETIEHHRESECPCSLQQMRLDSRYRHWYGYKDVLCYRRRGIFYFRHTNISFFTVCCYHPEEDFLYSGFSPKLGLTTQTYITQSYDWNILWYRHYRNLARSKATSDDMKAFDYCCVKNPLCHLYAQKRPVPDCQVSGYNPPVIGWSGGDPHIRTLDGYTYTFNGIGDFVLISLKNSSDFTVHCRMSRAIVKSNATRDPPKATVFTGFALSAEQGARVEIYLNLTTGNVTLFVNQQEYNNITSLINTETINGTDVTWKTGNRTQLTVIYESGAGAVINIFQTLLTIQIMSMPSFFGKTIGLLGVYNKDKTDDLTRQDGNSISINSSQKAIYYQFGATWNVTDNGSLFTMSQPYYDPKFTPHFFNDVNDLFGNNTGLKQEAISLCGETSFTCLFDVMATGDKTAAAESKSTLEESEADQKILVTYPPRILSPRHLVLEYQQHYNLSIVAKSATGSNLSYSLEATGIMSDIDSKSGNFSLYVNTSIFSLKFIVKDENSLASYVAPTLRLCYCLNGSSCNKTMKNPFASSPNYLLTYGACECINGSSGAFCQNPITSVCGPNTCFPGVNCTNGTVNSSAVCGPCPNGYYGDGRVCQDIDECTNGTAICEEHATCQNLVGTFNCSCNNGFTGNGTFCEDINECIDNTHNCHTFATCNNTVGAFECTCNANYTGNGTFCKDENQCEVGNHHCHANATCIDKEVQFFCVCNSGFEGNGTFCKDLDECEAKTHNCHQHAKCKNINGNFACSCRDGFTGNGTFCQDINECETTTDNCDKNATCKNTIGSFNCSCIDGFTGNGTVCKDVNECDAGTHNCHKKATCFNIDAGYRCTCNAGFTGNGTVCKDINECETTTDNCDKNATCKNTIGSFNCSCIDGFTGNGTVCKDVNECDAGTHNCHKKATCFNIDAGYRCTCNAGFTGNGTVCKVVADQNQCDTGGHDCHEHASCSNKNGRYQCSCKEGFTGNGTFCQEIGVIVASKSKISYVYLAIGLCSTAVFLLMVALVCKKVLVLNKQVKKKITSPEINKAFEEEQRYAADLPEIEMTTAVESKVSQIA